MLGACCNARVARRRCFDARVELVVDLGRRIDGQTVGLAALLLAFAT